MEELAAAQDFDELRRLLLRSPWGWGLSTRYPARLGDILVCAEEMPPRHRDAPLNGLLDTAGGLEAAQRRQLMGQALRSDIARVRRAASTG